MIGRELVEKHFRPGLKFSTTAADVCIIARHRGRITFKKCYAASEWSEIRGFLDDIRRRLDITELPESVDVLQREVENLLKRYRHSRDLARERLREIRVLREGYVDSEGLRDIVDLQRRTRARGELEQLAGIRLHRWSHPTIKSIVREAQEALR